MDRDEISAAQQGIQVNLLHAQIAGTLGRQEGIEGDNLHFQTLGAVCDDRTDITCPDQAQGFAKQLHAHEFGLLPFPSPGRGISGGNLAGQRHHHGNGMFCRGNGIPKGRVHHHRAKARGSSQIDIIHTDTGAPDNL